MCSEMSCDTFFVVLLTYVYVKSDFRHYSILKRFNHCRSSAKFKLERNQLSALMQALHSAVCLCLCVCLRFSLSLCLCLSVSVSLSLSLPPPSPLSLPPSPLFLSRSIMLVWSFLMFCQVEPLSLIKDHSHERQLTILLSLLLFPFYIPMYMNS